MMVFNVDIPYKALTNIEVARYVKELNIPYFRGVYMRDTLPEKVWENECAIVNLNTSKECGSHWVCYWYRNTKSKQRIYFDSFGCVTLIEIQRHLKTKYEMQYSIPTIERNTEMVQVINTPICGHLCLYVLKMLADGNSFQDVINSLYVKNVLSAM